MTTITPADESLHEPYDDPNWQESWYFSWFDGANRAAGLARIGYLPNSGEWSAGVMVAGPDGIERGFANMKHKGGPQHPEALTIGRLTFRMIEPLRTWRVVVEGRDGLDLTFTAINDAFDFADGPAGPALLTGVADRHFEQTGRVTGTVRVGGKTTQIDGYGQRDKSWGPRDWGALEGWNWIPVLFDDDLAFCTTRVTVGGTTHVGGYIWHDGANHPIAKLRVQPVWRSRRVPAATRVVVTDTSGFTIDTLGTSYAQAPLFNKGAMLQQSPSSWVATVDGEERTAVGISDYLYDPDLRDKIAYIPGFLNLLTKMRKL